MHILSRPWNKVTGGGGGGKAGLTENFLRPFGPQFRLKINGEAGPSQTLKKLNFNAPINIMPAGRGGRGMGWGFDCRCWPWDRAFDWSCSPRGGDIWIFLLPRWRYLTADSDEKDWDRTYVSHFHASRMRRTVWKDLEIMEANENKRKLGGFHCFVFKFCLF